VFRSKPLRRVFGHAPPWAAYQLTFPAGVFPLFDDSGSLLNADYQFGASLEAQWNGTVVPEASEADSPPPFDHPIVTSRLTAFHRSSHLGDEYLATSRFGRNLERTPAAPSAFDHPPVKRVDLSFEAVSGAFSVEWSPGRARHSVARAYAGFEARPLMPLRWGIGALRPHNLRSPAWTLGGEWLGAGNGPIPEARLARWVNAVLREPAVDAAWFAAAELRLAKPYNFASADNPNGESEVWTPRLWTDAPYGREFRHDAGSWHAMVGAVAWPRASRSRSPLAGREWRAALEWYRGYSPDGQFLDQRLRWHPRWYVVPSLSANF
jgi:hypothetical protein